MVGFQVAQEVLFHFLGGIEFEFLVLVPVRLFLFLLRHIAFLNGIGRLLGLGGLLFLVGFPGGGLLLAAAFRVFFLGAALFFDLGLVFLFPLTHEGQHDAGADQGIEDPVEAHQGREGTGEEEEHQRHHEHHHALGAVRAVRGGEPLLDKGGSGHDEGQDDAGGIGFGQIFDPHEVESGIDDLRIGRLQRVVGADGREQPDEDGHLDEQGQAARRGRAVVLLVQGGGGLVHLLGIGSVAAADLVQLGL